MSSERPPPHAKSDSLWREELEHLLEEQTFVLHDYARRLEREHGEVIRLEAELAALRGQQSIAVREIHHRVRNNLQVLVSLMRLSREGVGAEAAHVLHEMSRRVVAMLAAHEEFYRSAHVGTVDLERFLRQLIDVTIADSGDPGLRIDLEVAHRRAVFRIEVAVPLAIVLNELFICAAQVSATNVVRVGATLLSSEALLQIRVWPACVAADPQSLSARICDALMASLEAWWTTEPASAELGGGEALVLNVPLSPQDAPSSQKEASASPLAPEVAAHEPDTSPKAK